MLTAIETAHAEIAALRSELGRVRSVGLDAMARALVAERRLQAVERERDQFAHEWGRELALRQDLEARLAGRALP